MRQLFRAQAAIQVSQVVDFLFGKGTAKGVRSEVDQCVELLRFAVDQSLPKFIRPLMKRSDRLVETTVLRMVFRGLDQ